MARSSRSTTGSARACPTCTCTWCRDGARTACAGSSGRGRSTTATRRWRPSRTPCVPRYAVTRAEPDRRASRERPPSPVRAARLQQPQEGSLVEHGDAELVRLVELGRARPLTGHDVVGLLGHAARGLAAALLDGLLRALARQRLERAGHDHRLAGERLWHVGRLRALEV